MNKLFTTLFFVLTLALLSSCSQTGHTHEDHDKYHKQDCSCDCSGCSECDCSKCETCSKKESGCSMEGKDCKCDGCGKKESGCGMKGKKEGCFGKTDGGSCGGGCSGKK